MLDKQNNGVDSDGEDENGTNTKVVLFHICSGLGLSADDFYHLDTIYISWWIIWYGMLVASLSSSDGIGSHWLR